MYMNNFTFQGEATERTDIISDQVTSYIQFAVVILTSSFVSLFGIVANSINMVVYLKQGLKDSVTVQFFSLSVADCMFCILVLASSISVLFSEIYPNATVLDPLSVSYCLSLPREKVYSLAIIITIFLSVERCLCVALPFAVKRLFTRFRSGTVVVSTSFILGALLIPDYLTEGLVWMYDIRFNSTRLLFWHADDRINFDLVKIIIFNGVLPVCACVTNTICALVMIARIKISKEFRQLKASTHDTKQALTSTTEQSKTNTILNRSSGFTKKDVRVTRTIIIVDVIFIVCNTPMCMVIVITVLELFIPEFSYHEAGQFQNLSTVILHVCYTMETINASVNFFIYLASSSKFRSVFSDILCNCKYSPKNRCPQRLLTCKQ